MTAAIRDADSSRLDARQADRGDRLTERDEHEKLDQPLHEVTRARSPHPGGASGRARASNDRRSGRHSRPRGRPARRRSARRRRPARRSTRSRQPIPFQIRMRRTGAYDQADRRAGRSRISGTIRLRAVWIPTYPITSRSARSPNASGIGDRPEHAREHSPTMSAARSDRRVGVVPVGHPGRVDPGPPGDQQQERRLPSADERQVAEQQRRQLGDNDDEDEVEEQLDRAGAPFLVRAGPAAQVAPGS